MSRIALPNGIRFEVFKRDSFTCQYCGRKAPDVVLQCDHIVPVAGGGTNDPMNLATSCVECNSGKSDKSLDETHILNRQRAEMELLNERRQQLEMLIAWRDQLQSVVQDEAILVGEKIAKTFSALDRVNLSDAVLSGLRKWIKRFGVEMLLDASEASASSYLVYGDDREPTDESINKAWNMIPRVAAVLQRSKSNPELARLYYVRGILRRRLRYCDDAKAMALMQEALMFNMDVEWLEAFSKRVRNWAEFRRTLNDFIAAEVDAEEGED